MTTTVYQLHARGVCQNFHQTVTPIHSTTVFTTREAAKARIDRFRAMVTDPRRLNALSPDGLEILIVALDIVE